MNENVKVKNEYWQWVRAICILAVVMIHCPNGTDYGSGSFEYNLTIILRSFINFPVAVFVFLAAYFTNVERVEKDYKSYIFKRGGDDY